MIGMKRCPILIVFLLICIIAVPVQAGSKYMSGGPELTAAISGPNEFKPGDTVPLNIKVENSGLISVKFAQSGIIERDDLPNTAKMVVADLAAGESPLVIKSDPQRIGDIPGGKSAQASFLIKIPSETPGGTFSLPLHLSYTYLAMAEQEGQDNVQYIYNVKEKTLVLPFRVRPVAALTVLSVTPEQLNVGTEGFVTLQVRNTGSEPAKKAVIKITRNGNSPVIPTDSSVYIGEYPDGATITPRFKVSVSSDAEGQTYPLDVALIYENSEGDTATSEIVTVGVPVGGKISFAVSSPPAAVTPGSKRVIDVVYKNTGNATVFNAQARISAVDPFTSNDDTAYLGDLAAGESAVAHFEISTEKSAVLKEYGLDSEVRYRDSLNNSQISDTLKVRISVVQRLDSDTDYLNYVWVTLLVAVLAGFGYWWFVMRKKGRNPGSPE
jgi:hypothetical protein